MKIRNNFTDNISSWTWALGLDHPSEILFRLYPKTLNTIYQENRWKKPNQCSHTLEVFTVFTKANSMVLWGKESVAEKESKIHYSIIRVCFENKLRPDRQSRK